jgi:hypothetical protein
MVRAYPRNCMSENIINRSVLTDGILALANYFREHGFNPPISIMVDKLAFEKILSESDVIVIKEQKLRKT